ncbi:MAG TPA: RsbRD N-terminal domain-containing protein [Longimicrobiaceae bacterium]|nr:RsbRD N-terminal domain-containing protein [Longimicrobiaceae bacterium]
MNIGASLYDIEVKDVGDVLPVLRAGREAILLEWVQRVRENAAVVAGRALPDPILLDHVPQLFDAIVDRLQFNRNRADAEYFAAVHGFGRRVDGYDVAESVAELSMFRRAIWTHLSAVGTRPEGAFAAMQVIDGMIDRVVLVSLRAFLNPDARMLERRAAARDAAL